MTTTNKECCSECTTAKFGLSIPQCFNKSCKCHTPTKAPESTEAWEDRFNVYGIGRYTTEYGYEHKVPNYDEIKAFIQTEIDSIRSDR